MSDSQGVLPNIISKVLVFSGVCFGSGICYLSADA